MLQLRVVSLPVRDQDRARAFYVEKLGFEVRTDSPMGEGQRWIEVAPAGSPVSFTLVTWFPSMPPGAQQGLVLGTDDVRAAYAELRARGIAFDHEVKVEDWGTFTSFSDPDGNGWVLAQLSRPA